MRRIAESVSEIKSVAPPTATHYQWSKAPERFRPMQDDYFPVETGGSPDLSLGKSSMVYLRFFRREGEGWEVVETDGKVCLMTGMADSEDKKEPVAQSSAATAISTPDERRELREIEARAKRAEHEISALKARDEVIEKKDARIRELTDERIAELKARVKTLETEIAETPKGTTLLDVMIHKDGHRMVENIILAMKSAGIVFGHITDKKKTKKGLKEMLLALSPEDKAELAKHLLTDGKVTEQEGGKDE